MANQWNLALDLTNVNPFDPTRSSLPTGVYRVKVLDADMRQGSDPAKGPSVMFDLQVVEGPSHGAGTAVFLGTDMAKKGILATWKTLLMSCGAPPSMTEAKLTVAPNTFIGKQAWIYIVAKPEGAGKDEYDQRNFVTPEQAQRLIALFTQQGQQTSQQQQTQPTQPAPTSFGQPAPSNGVPQPNASGMGGLANAMTPNAPAGGVATF